MIFKDLYRQLQIHVEPYNNKNKARGKTKKKLNLTRKMILEKIQKNKSHRTTE